VGRAKKLLAAVAVCATAVVGVSASAGIAREVRGRPGTRGVASSRSGRHRSQVCAGVAQRQSLFQADDTGSIPGFLPGHRHTPTRSAPSAELNDPDEDPFEP
jgi:hypothetical protein